MFPPHALQLRNMLLSPWRASEQVPIYSWRTPHNEQTPFLTFHASIFKKEFTDVLNGKKPQDATYILCRSPKAPAQVSLIQTDRNLKMCRGNRYDTPGIERLDFPLPFLVILRRNAIGARHPGSGKNCRHLLHKRFWL